MSGNTFVSYSHRDAAAVEYLHRELVGLLRGPLGRPRI